MKILIDGTYKWEDASYDPTRDSIIYKGSRISEVSILGVVENEQENYVRCSACRSIIHKDMIDTHKHKSDLYETCYDCNHRIRTTQTENKSNYVLLENGLFNENISKTVKLSCGRNVPIDITDERARLTCVFAQCKTASYDNVNSFFIKYPNAFDEVLTKKAFDKWEYDENGSCFYKNVKINTDGRILTVNIIPIINRFDIASSFDMQTIYGSCSVRYSFKYNEIFSLRHSSYEVFKYHFGCEYRECPIEIKDEIKKLYTQGE